MRSTRTLLFVQGAAWVDGEAVLHASGVFKWGDAWIGPADPCDPFGVRPGKPLASSLKPG